MDLARKTYDEMQFLLDYMRETNPLMSRSAIEDKFMSIMDSVLCRILSDLKLDNETHFGYVQDCLESGIAYDMMLEGLNKEVIR